MKNRFNFILSGVLHIKNDGRFWGRRKPASFAQGTGGRTRQLRPSGCRLESQAGRNDWF
jgi:hypothetical protein